MAVAPSAVAAVPAATRSFPADRDAARAARHFALDLLRSWRLEQRYGVTLTSDVAIVVGELASNAIRHAGSGFTVSLVLADDAVRISVADAGPLPRVRRDPPLPVSPDHGLSLVAAVAARWGVQPAAGGKEVWAELPLT